MLDDRWDVDADSSASHSLEPLKHDVMNVLAPQVGKPTLQPVNDALDLVLVWSGHRSRPSCRYPSHRFVGWAVRAKRPGTKGPAHPRANGFEWSCRTEESHREQAAARMTVISALEVETLTADECWRLLPPTGLDRLAMAVGDRPEIYPVTGMSPSRSRADVSRGRATPRTGSRTADT